MTHALWWFSMGDLMLFNPGKWTAKSNGEKSKELYGVGTTYWYVDLCNSTQHVVLGVFTSED